MNYSNSFGIVENMQYLNIEVFSSVIPIIIPIIVIITGVLFLCNSRRGSSILLSAIIVVPTVIALSSYCLGDSDFGEENFLKKLNHSSLETTYKTQLNDFYNNFKEKESEEAISTLRKNLTLFFDKESELDKNQKEEYINDLYQRKRDNNLYKAKKIKSESVSESVVERKLNKIYWMLFAIFIFLFINTR